MLLTMVKSLLIFVGQDLSMVKCVLTNVIQATHVLGLVQTGVAVASGHKADFTARVNYICRSVVIAKY